jgi:predicted CXXCH cytochrome family protein
VGAPLSASLRMPRPGIRRAELAPEHTSRVDGATDDFHPSGDSRSFHQQYSDFIRQGMARNGVVLMTCSSCHDPHGSEERAMLRFDPDLNEGCTSCHSDDRFLDPYLHLEEAVGEPHDALRPSELICTSCHMVRTATAGARVPELLDRSGGTEPVQYFHGDRHSHRFNVPRRDVASVQPSAATLECALCHGRFLPNP